MTANEKKSATPFTASSFETGGHDIMPEAALKPAHIKTCSIHAAHSLTKTSTTDVQTFMSPLRGLVGISAYGKNDFYNSPVWKHTAASEFDISNVSKLPRVDIVFACADMSPDLIDASANNGAKGIVIAGVGNGNMNKASLEAAAKAAKRGVIVIRSSRVAMGSLDVT